MRNVVQDFNPEFRYEELRRTLLTDLAGLPPLDNSADWEDSAQGAVALTIVLDQFPLNMFRDRPESLSTEAESRRVASSAIEKEFDRETG